MPGIRRERVQVDDDERDRLDAVRRQVGAVGRVVEVGEDAAVHRRVQRDDAVAEDRRHAGEVGDVGDGDAGAGDGARRAAARHERPPEVGEAAGEVDDAGSCRTRTAARWARSDRNERTPRRPRHPRPPVRETPLGARWATVRLRGGRGRPLEKRFESYDWLKAIGEHAVLRRGDPALVGTGTSSALELRQTGFGDWLGIIAAIAILGVGLLTVIVETESLPIPRWVLNPTWMLALSIVGVVCVGVRFFLDPFGAGGPGIRDTRGLGLYLAGAGAVLVLIGCVMAFQHREEWAEAVAPRRRGRRRRRRRPRRVRLRRRRAGRADPAHQRVDGAAVQRAPQPHAPEEPQPTVQQQRKAERAERTEQAPTRRRRPTGPPIP